MWDPLTFEDRLVARYLEEHPGELFLELPVGGTDPTRGPRRIDGVLVPGDESHPRPQRSYALDEARSSISGRTVHLLEAKKLLNRFVIGQVEVGVELLKRDFEPAEIVPVAVCSGGNLDLEWYCEEKGIEAVIYPDLAQPIGPRLTTSDGRLDIRKAPDAGRRRAFLKGWSAAVNGQLYGSVRRKKTHMNMGNLFGWIYGDHTEEFKLETWERYVNSSEIAGGEDAGE